MPTMTPVQVRLSEEQLHLIDRKVQEGRYPNRFEAIRDYLRKAQLWEALEQLLQMGDLEGDEEEIRADLQRLRSEVYKTSIRPKRPRSASRT
ncbi:MAG: hypothetical protein KatS3mg131_0303 [Candidatus Tectimicrobiota bacterium]|nr:MAG: hypothetical protein KatS3mg131_0303 [Candidatus Tectomicrobia bacterium]